MRHVSMLVKIVNELDWGRLDGWWVVGTEKDGIWIVGEEHEGKWLLAGCEDASGGWLHRHTHVGLSRGLGSDTSFEQSHATSKTFKWSSPLLQIKLQGCVCVYNCVNFCFCLRGLRKWQRRKKKHQEVERCVGLSSLSVSKRGVYRKWTQSACVHKSL